MYWPAAGSVCRLTLAPSGQKHCANSLFADLSQFDSCQIAKSAPVRRSLILIAASDRMRQPHLFPNAGGRMAVNSQIDGEAISEGLERLANEVNAEQQHQNPPASDSSMIGDMVAEVCPAAPRLAARRGWSWPAPRRVTCAKPGCLSGHRRPAQPPQPGHPPRRSTRCVVT
jgi:hypothetical protein